MEVTSGEVGDEQLLGRLVREHVGTTGRTVAEVVADTKYGTQANYLALEAARIRASIQPCPGGGVRRVLGREQFVYEPAADRYRCPAGQPMRRMGRTRTGTPLGGIQYPADPQTCRTCRLKPDCCGTAAARTITRPDDAGLFERLRAHLATGPAKRGLRRRACWVETANAELKEHHGLRRTQCWGRAKIQTQAYGAAIAYNVKELAAGVRRRPVPAAGALHVGPCCRAATECRSARGRHVSPSRDFGNRPCTGSQTGQPAWRMQARMRCGSRRRPATARFTRIAGRSTPLRFGFRQPGHRPGASAGSGSTARSNSRPTPGRDA